MKAYPSGTFTDKHLNSIIYINDGTGYSPTTTKKLKKVSYYQPYLLEHSRHKYNLQMGMQEGFWGSVPTDE